jgi:hypothetical protein
MSQIQTVLGMFSDLVASKVPDLSNARKFVPVLAFASLAAGDEPMAGGLVVLMHRVNTLSNPPVGEGVTCSCHI